MTSPRFSSLRALLLAVTGAIAACDRPASYTLNEITDSPATGGSHFPVVTADSSGRVVLSWTERGADSVTVVRFAVHRDGNGWSEPRTLVRDTSLLMNWADFASVIPTNDGGLVGQWLQRGTERHAYDLVLARSRDEGATWSAPVIPHGRVKAAEHGFVSAFGLPGGATAIQFLDGSVNADSTKAMALQHVVFDTNASIARTELLDARICDCCQTDAAVAASGPVVVYRDRLEGEIRDIAVVRRVKDVWTAPVRVHADGWHIEGCPVNGPAIAADKNDVVVAWFTAARDTARVRFARSSDGGATFSAPVEIDAGPEVVGRVDVAMTGSGDAIVTWLHRTSKTRAEVRASAVDRTGATTWTASLGETDAGRASGFPRSTRARDGVLVAWTETGTPSRVRMLKILAR